MYSAASPRSVAIVRPSLLFAASATTTSGLITVKPAQKSSSHPPIPRSSVASLEAPGVKLGGCWVLALRVPVAGATRTAAGEASTDAGAWKGGPSVYPHALQKAWSSGFRTPHLPQNICASRALADHTFVQQVAVVKFKGMTRDVLPGLSRASFGPGRPAVPASSRRACAGRW